jgi:hypothetical protein
MTELTETVDVPMNVAPPTLAERVVVAPIVQHRHDVAPTVLVGGSFFADVVRAHYAWERALSDGTVPSRVAELAKAYEDTLKQFERDEGQILDAYWCVRRSSAVAVTEKRQSRWEKIIGEQRVRLHRLSNWMMPRNAQKLDLLLHECDEFAIKSEEILRGAPKRIALRSIYEVESAVLGFLERTGGKPTVAEVDEFVGSVNRGMHAARECYANAADKVARMVYVSGLFAGVGAMLPVSILAAVGLWIFGAFHPDEAGTQTFFACLTAGALGAFVSVLSRMASPAKFDLDPEVGRRAIFYLGAYRPLVGAIFGLSLYFLLQSNLLQVQPTNEFPTFIVAAFLGGFSERFVKVMLHSAEKTVGGAPSPPTATVPDPNQPASETTT